jgi:hypothetical protein
MSKVPGIGRSGRVTVVEPAAPAGVAPVGGRPAASVVDVTVMLEPGFGLQVEREYEEGYVPLVEFVTGHARVVIGFEVLYPDQLGPQHVALAQRFAQAAAAFHEQTRKLAAAR